MPSNFDLVTTSVDYIGLTLSGYPHVVSYSSIDMLPGIPHADQLEIERLFDTGAKTGSTVFTIADRRKMFKLPKNWYTINETTKEISILQFSTIANANVTFNLTTGLGLKYYAIDDANTSVVIPNLGANDTIIIRRKTLSEEKIVNFTAGSRLTSGQLNLSSNQLINIIQELLWKVDNEVIIKYDKDAIDGPFLGTVSGAFVDVTGNIDMNGQRVTNLGYSGTLDDAMPKKEITDTVFRHGVITKDTTPTNTPGVQNDIIEGAANEGRSGVWFNPLDGKLRAWAGNSWVIVTNAINPAVNPFLVQTNTTQSISGQKTFLAPTTFDSTVTMTSNLAVTGNITTSGSLSSSSVLYTPSGAGAVARSAASKFNDVISVKDFGAVGDGVADDTAAINAAIARAAATVGGAIGATVYFPPGTYLISSTITMPNRVGLVGDNNRGTIIKPHSSFASSYMFNAVNGTNSMFGSYLRDMYIDARGKNMTAVVWSQAWQEACGMDRVVVQFDGTTNYGVLFTDGYAGAAMTSIVDCEIFSNSTFASAAGIQVNQISVSGGFVLTVRNCTIAGSPTNTLPYGIRLANDSCDISVYHGEYVTSMLSCAGVGAIRAASLTGSSSGTVNLVTMESTFTGKMALESLIPNNASGNIINDNATSRHIAASEGKITNFSYGSPFVSAYVSAQIPNVTGNGTQYTIVFDTEIADYTSNFNTTNGSFIAPLTGKYLITTTVKLSLPATITTYIVQIATSNRTYHVFRGDTDSLRDGGGFVTVSGSVIADMDKTDSAVVSITVTGVGSDTVDVEANETALQIAYLGR